MLGQLPKWPKRLPQLSDEQLRIRDQFMAEWHDELPQRYKLIERFNHGYPVRRCGALRQGFRTLEIGAGLGGHLEFENLGAQEYFALELRPEMAARLQQRYPQCRTIVCDCQQFCVVIPCEGGIAYSLARNISARRLFEKRFGQSYDWLIQSEHINVPQEIFEELSRLFEIQHREFFPLPFPVVTLNLCIGLTLKPRRGMRSERDRSGAQRPR
jgi:hypothetical protein